MRARPHKVDPLTAAVRSILRGVRETGKPPEVLAAPGWAGRLALDLIRHRRLVRRNSRGRPRHDEHPEGKFRLTKAGALADMGEPLHFRPTDHCALARYYCTAFPDLRTEELALWLGVSERTARTRLRDIGALPNGRGGWTYGEG